MGERIFLLLFVGATVVAIPLEWWLRRRRGGDVPHVRADIVKPIAGDRVAVVADAATGVAIVGFSVADGQLLWGVLPALLLGAIVGLAVHRVRVRKQK